MVVLLLTFLRTKWRWLVFPAVAIFGVLLLTQTVDYLRQQSQHRQLEQQQAAAGKQATASQQAGQAAHGAYLIDSTKYATQREALLSGRPPRVVLPETPPKEL